jgi:uncharacterized protein
MTASSTATSNLLTRRRLLQFLSGITLTGLATFAYTRLVEPRWVDIEHITLAVPGLPDQLAGKRIAHLTDIHLSEFMGATQLVDAVRIVNSLAPDWLFLTGDYVGDNAAYAADLIEPLRQLTMPIYAVYGNHDYWSEIGTVRAALDQAGVHTLRNEALPLADQLWVAGADDIWSGRPDLAATLQGVPSDVTTLLLAHEPDFFDRVVQRQAPVAVQFSGHSHGGQVRLPTLHRGQDGRYTYAPVLPRYGRLYPIGLRRVGHQQVYTNRGLGVWPAPYRLNCRPEITLFTLVPGD